MSTLQTMVADWEERALFGLDYCTQTEDGTTVLYYTDGSTRTMVMERRLYLDEHSLSSVQLHFDVYEEKNHAG